MKRPKRKENIMLLAIRKPYSELIIHGKKRYELRKRSPKLNCQYALIYETHPTQAIVGYFEISKIHVGSVSEIWKMTSGKSYLSKCEFEEYYKNKDYAVAFGIKRSERLDRPMNLSELGIASAPQDYMYLKGVDLEGLIGL